MALTREEEIRKEQAKLMEKEKMRIMARNENKRREQAELAKLEKMRIDIKMKVQRNETNEIKKLEKEIQELISKKTKSKDPRQVENLNIKIGLLERQIKTRQIRRDNPPTLQLDSTIEGQKRKVAALNTGF